MSALVICWLPPTLLSVMPGISALVHSHAHGGELPAGAAPGWRALA